MAKNTNTNAASRRSDEFVTQPIGSQKAAKFAEVEGLKMSASSKALAQKLAASGLKGDAYRAEISKAFKKA